MAIIPAGTNTNSVTLISLSFSSTAAAFHVYRGANPIQLLRIASNVAIAQQFIDNGATPLLMGPPDYNYDHANFYWRLELQPPESVDIYCASTVGNSTLNMLPAEYNGATVRITEGTGAGQEQIVAANTATTVTTTTNWSVEPDATSVFLVADSSWQFGASSSSSPVSFVVPNREGVTVHVSGRAANVSDDEASYELSPLTSWQISGSAGDILDSDIPGLPAFGLFPNGRGGIEAVSVGFTSLTNTRTISAGTLVLGYWDELNGPSTVMLTASMGTGDIAFTVTAAVSAAAGDLVQIDSEIMVVQQAVTAGTTFEVARASHGTSAAIHTIPVGVYFLEQKTFIMPFVQDFLAVRPAEAMLIRCPYPTCGSRRPTCSSQIHEETARWQCKVLRPPAILACGHYRAANCPFRWRAPWRSKPTLLRRF